MSNPHQVVRSPKRGGCLPISDMRMVLLGYRTAGKSSSGNSILGREEFSTSGRTAECVKREGETAGRRITVVEAPGWWRNYTVEKTPERDKQEIVLSVSLCPPGPHALLLLIRVSESFTETFRRAVQEHMELLGERVWSHTIVLFTWGDCLGDTSIEQHIESGGEALQWVVGKCGNRYHVVDNMKRDGGQVTELLEKIEEMVAGNRGHQLNFNAAILKKLKEKKEEEERRAEERKRKMLKQRRTLRSAAGGYLPISDMRMVLLGYRGAGKSSSGNSILGREEFSTSGRTAECVKREGETAGRRITVVEAPGWWGNYTLEKTPERDKREIVLSVSLCPPGPHALLLLIDVSWSFTETHIRLVQEHMELLGERVWSHTIVLFTYGDCLGDTSIEQHIESGGEALQWVVEKCGNRYHVVDNKKRDGGQVTELLEKIEEMVAGNKGCPFQLKKSMELPPKLGGHTPDERSGSRPGRVCDLVKPFEGLSVAASTQSSGYSTGLSTEESGSGEMITVIRRTKPHAGDQTLRPEHAQAHVGDQALRPEHAQAHATKQKERRKEIHFVDASTITVDYSNCIGRGSYGTVYKGSYQGTPAAVKTMPIGDSSVITNEFLVPLVKLRTIPFESFFVSITLPNIQDALGAIRRLSHPHIVRMMAVAKSETQILIANQYIHGANLQQVLSRDHPSKLQFEDKLFVALEITMAVEYIHGKQIIHQDLKPANIMITADSRKAYLTDWGMANWQETMSITRASRQGAQCGPQGGTPPYMAPECLVDCEDCSTSSDMWSLGITLLEMFSNSEPWTYSKVQELRRFLSKQQAPHALAQLQPQMAGVIKPLLDYEPESRMRAKDLVTLLKSKVDLTKRYGHSW
ncbi:uncharacterized protein LOC134082355 isoform X2 [Sardina pilchardus]|uniref:uncharacterized protein LOC134082355 isoform X2 n=1 Tax=Sardina pilchardus TaxID=27697 RepID=UPI002E138F50